MPFTAVSFAAVDLRSFFTRIAIKTTCPSVSFTAPPESALPHPIAYNGYYTRGKCSFVVLAMCVPQSQSYPGGGPVARRTLPSSPLPHRPDPLSIARTELTNAFDVYIRISSGCLCIPSGTVAHHGSADGRTVCQLHTPGLRTVLSRTRAEHSARVLEPRRRIADPATVQSHRVILQARFKWQVFAVHRA
jgi:hypothetical protein